MKILPKTPIKKLENNLSRQMNVNLSLPISSSSFSWWSSSSISSFFASSSPSTEKSVMLFPRLTSCGYSRKKKKKSTTSTKYYHFPIFPLSKKLLAKTEKKLCICNFLDLVLHSMARIQLQVGPGLQSIRTNASLQ